MDQIPDAVVCCWVTPTLGPLHDSRHDCFESGVFPLLSIIPVCLLSYPASALILASVPLLILMAKKSLTPPNYLFHFILFYFIF